MTSSPDLLKAIDRVHAIISFDPEGMILEANQNYLDLMGYRLDEIQGKHHSLFCDPGYRATLEYAQFWTDLQGGQVVNREFRRIHKSGRSVWLQSSYNPIMSAEGALARVVKFATDVTLAKHQAAELSSIAAAMDRSMSIIEFDMNGNVLAVNDKFTELAGYTTEMMQNLPQKQFLPKTDEEMRNHDALWSRLRAGEVVEKEFYRKHVNGSDLYVFSYYNPIFGPDGKPYKVMSFSTNLTERYAMERDLRHAKEKAETAVVAKSAFLANMSHELRTPMNAILGFTDILLDEPMAEEHLRYLRTVHSSAENLLKLLNDILDTAKLDYGAVELEVEPFSLKDSCRQTLAMVAVLAEEKGLDLQLDYPAHMPESFLGDRVRLQQILINLIGNAVKFTEQGQVRVVCRYQADVVQIAVQDTGIGIEQDRLAKIFEPFVQADASMTRRFGGTGLGTTIARQLAELMGGRIEASSQEGVGSEFRVELPLALHRSGTVALLQSTVALEPLHVLLVDDVSQNLDLLAVLLSKGGHTCVTAVDGLEAVEKFQQDHFDVILMDMQMPVMDGLQATQAIRLIEAEASLPRTPIIAVTANAMEADREAALRAGMDGFVAKPVQQNALYAEMRRLCAPEGV